MKNFALSSIRFYQKFLRIGLACRFTPTCSEYTYQAVSKYGILPGVWLGLKRLVRCHPWSAGGSDPVPDLG